MNSTDTKKAVQTLIKKLGYNNRQASVSIKRGSTEAMVIVTVRDASVNFETLREQAETLDTVSRDERTQEILAGGNTYIHVRKAK